MNIGQVVSQMPVGAGPETALSLLVDSANIESKTLQASVFGDVLRDMSSQGNSLVRSVQAGTKVPQTAGDVSAETSASPGQQIGTMPVDMKRFIPAGSDGEMLGVLEALVTERIPEDSDDQQLKNPQNVVMSASGAQLLSLLQVAGRMPEQQIADQKNMADGGLSVSVSNAAEALTTTVIQKLLDVLPHHEAVARPPAAAQSDQQSEVIEVVSNAPSAGRVVVVPVSTPAASGDNNDIRLSVTPAQPRLAALPVVAPEVHANRTDSVLDAYNQTSSRPATVSASAIQPAAAADGSSSQLELTASAPPVTPAITSESPPIITRVPLVSRLAPAAPAAPAATELADPVIPATVTHSVASVPRVTGDQSVTATPEAPSVVHPASALPEAIVTVPVTAGTPETAAVSDRAVVVPVVTPATSGETGKIRPAVMSAAPSLAAASPVVAAPAQTNLTEPVLDAYYQTSARPSTASAYATQPVVAADSSTSQPLVTASALPAPPATTSESTPAATHAPLVSRVVSAASGKPEPANSVSVMQSVVSAPRTAVVISAEVSPEVPGTAYPAPAQPTPAQPETGQQPEAAMVSSTVPVSVSAGIRETAPVPGHTVVVPVVTPAVSGETSTIRPALASVLPSLTVPSPPVVTSVESTPAITRASLVNLQAPAESVVPAVPVAAELSEPGIPAAVTQTVSSAARGTVVPLRNPDKNVQEVSPLRQGTVSENGMSEHITTMTSSSVKAPAMLDSGENMPGSGNEGAERNLNGQAHLLVQPPKAEQPAVITNPSTGDEHSPLTKESMEHVVQQVKDHLAVRDYKTGTEQVTIRLAPEHMGELKLNLRMENQQLKVEIVAENASVRDALLKHSDSLRETLAKQNITMESFDVTTGGKGSANQGHNQNAWRELVKQQQQQQFWTSPRGYNIAQADIPTGQAANQRQQGHSMLDIHY